MVHFDNSPPFGQSLLRAPRAVRVRLCECHSGEGMFSGEEGAPEHYEEEEDGEEAEHEPAVALQVLHVALQLVVALLGIEQRLVHILIHTLQLRALHAHHLGQLLEDTAKLGDGRLHAVDGGGAAVQVVARLHPLRLRLELHGCQMDRLMFWLKQAPRHPPGQFLDPVVFDPQAVNRPSASSAYSSAYSAHSSAHSAAYSAAISAYNASSAISAAHSAVSSAYSAHSSAHSAAYSAHSAAISAYNASRYISKV